MRSVKNGKLFEDIPARSFCRSAQHALTPCQTRQRVRPTGTARHGSSVQPVPIQQNLLPLSRQQPHQQNPESDTNEHQAADNLHALSQHRPQVPPDADGQQRHA
jgi:hypothetical protein